jgi:hypothetical protein
MFRIWFSLDIKQFLAQICSVGQNKYGVGPMVSALKSTDTDRLQKYLSST